MLRNPSIPEAIRAAGEAIAEARHRREFARELATLGFDAEAADLRLQALEFQRFAVALQRQAVDDLLESGRLVERRWPRAGTEPGHPRPRT